MADGDIAVDVHFLTLVLVICRYAISLFFTVLVVANAIFLWNYYYFFVELLIWR